MNTQEIEADPSRPNLNSQATTGSPTTLLSPPRTQEVAWPLSQLASEDQPGLTAAATVCAATDAERRPSANTTSLLPLQVLPNKIAPLAAQLTKLIRGLVFDRGTAYAEMHGHGNAHLMRIGSPELTSLIRQVFRSNGINLKRLQLDEINEELRAEAQSSGKQCRVWHRVAPIPGGVEIARYDQERTQVRITPGKVEICAAGSDVLFYRPATASEMAMPATVGAYKLLHRYLNLDHVQFMLYVAWITYTLAHPKVPTSKYVILVFQGDQGSGKSHASRVTLTLTDPGEVGISRLPATEADLAIATVNAHVLAYDNLRSIPAHVSDRLCVVSTGGSVAGRRLYTNDEQHVLTLHAALVLNGIPQLLEHPDLAQRCLQLRLRSLPEEKRLSDTDLAEQFNADLPTIQRGLFDLIANVLEHLPTAEVTNPERMIDFVRWLAAMEVVNGGPAGIYQAVYSDLLNETQLDSLQETVLGSAVLSFANSMTEDEWFGTPADFLSCLTATQPSSTQRSRAWPTNPIALTKRLVPLQAALRTQGIGLRFGRGKQRTITISKLP